VSNRSVPNKSDGSNRLSILNMIPLSILTPMFYVIYLSIGDYLEFGFYENGYSLSQSTINMLITSSLIRFISALLAVQILLFLPRILFFIFPKQDKTGTNIIKRFSVIYLSLLSLASAVSMGFFAYQSNKLVSNDPSISLNTLKIILANAYQNVYWVMLSFTLAGIVYCCIQSFLFSRYSFESEKETLWFCILPFILSLLLIFVLIISQTIDNILSALYIIIGILFGGRGGW